MRALIITNTPEQQRPDERVAYDVELDDTYPDPSNLTVTLYDLTLGTDVSATKLVGAGSIVGQVLFTPLVIELLPGHKYRLDVTFVSGGNLFRPYGIIYGITY